MIDASRKSKAEDGRMAVSKSLEQPVRSMTAFARARTEAAGFTLLLTIRSVNGRGLEVKLALPSLLDHLTMPLRTLLRQRLARGHVQLKLHLQAEESALVGMMESKLAPLLALTERLAGSAPAGVAPARLDGLLALAQNVGERSLPLDGETESALTEAAITLAGTVLDELVAMREAEGTRLKDTLRHQLMTMRTELAAARTAAERALPALRDRIRERLDMLLADRTGLDEGRLEQEVAILASRQDVTEEIDRLAFHLDAAERLLLTGGVIGRKLDFLAQELGREANTLTAKAQDPALNAAGLALKAVIEQFREQVQNVE